MISEETKRYIINLWDKYNKEIAVIPSIKQYLPLSDENTIIKFKNDDLYKQNYVMYVNENLINQTNEFLKQIIFHEFTHVYDSIVLRKYDFNNFKKLMNIYSEVHASEILMDQLIVTQNTMKYSLNNYVTHNVKLTLSSFMHQTYEHLKREFSLNTSNLLLSGYNYKKFYYYVGYVISLNKHGINYTCNFQDINIHLVDLFCKISNILITKNYNDDILIQCEDEINKKIKIAIKEDMKEFALFSCPKCGSNNVTKINNKHKTSIFLSKNKKWKCLNCKYKW